MTQLTKREQIAAMILQGWVSSPSFSVIKHTPTEWIEQRSSMALGAIEIADSLLKHLEETEPDLKPKEEEKVAIEIDPISTDDIVHWIVQNVGLSYKHRTDIAKKINQLVSYKVNKAKL